jgi:hypothetical protein
MEIIRKAQKPKDKYICEKCDFKCIYIRDWNRHIMRPKHQNTVFGNENPKKKPKKAQIKKEYICDCGKEYNTLSGLWKHQKKWQHTNTYDNNNENNTPKLSYDELSNIVLDIVKSNHELQKQNIELQKQVLDICKNIQPSVNNNTINNNCNNTFNLQVFLNETCKDAMNISEFIDNISLQLADLENMGRLGYVDGVSNIIIKNLNALDVEKRPMHCTDKKREIVYVKDDDEWQKEEDDKKRIKNVISSVVSKNLQLLSEYENTYPECMNPESKKSDEYNKIIMETMGGLNNNREKNKEKIIRKIAKEVVIEKN